MFFKPLFCTFFVFKLLIVLKVVKAYPLIKPRRQNIIIRLNVQWSMQKKRRKKKVNFSKFESLFLVES